MHLSVRGRLTGVPTPLHRLVMGNLLVKSCCKLGNADVRFILQLLSHALTGVVFLFARLWLGERKP